MRITWVTRSFLDYRIPVFKALDELCGHELTVIYYKDIPPVRCQEKLKQILGGRAIARETELRFGNRPKVDNASRANTMIRIPISPGLIWQVMKTKPEVLVSDGFMQWTYAALAVRALKRIPHVMLYERTAHTERNAGKLRTWYRKFVSRWIDAIGCNGVFTGEYIKELLDWGEDRLSYGHMVADVEGMTKKVESVTDAEVEALRTKLGIKGTMLLFVGQLIPRKGVIPLVTAWGKVKETLQEPCTLVLVGSGVDEDIIREKVRVNKIPDVVMTGAVDYDAIAPYYKAADCFVIPTLEDNWSLVVPEAMACGLPVATSIYNGCHPELVHSENGWTFDPLKKQSLMEVIQKIVSSKNQLKEMGLYSKQIVAKETAQRAAESIMEAIEKAKARCKK